MAVVWIVALGIVGFLLANYAVLRSRPADRQAIAAFLEGQQQEQVSVRRGLRRPGDHLGGRAPISALMFPSRATRVYVVVSRNRDGQLCHWRMGLDPWNRRSGLLVLSRRVLPAARF